MNTTDAHNQKIAKLTFASVYPMYVKKIETKGRTKEELHQVITWLTGFDDARLQELINEKVTFETFFRHASLNPNAKLITGLICGYRVEDFAQFIDMKLQSPQISSCAHAYQRATRGTESYFAPHSIAAMKISRTLQLCVVL